MPTAIDRPGYEGGGVDALAEWYTKQRQRNPYFEAPDGYVWRGDHYERDNSDWTSRLGKVAAGAGIGAMALGGAGLAGVGPAAAGAGGGVAPALAGVVPDMPGEAGGPGAAAGGGGGILNFLRNPGNLLGMAGDLGSVLGGQAQGAAQGRMTEADLLSRRDLAQNQQYGVRQNAEMNAGNLDLARKNFSESARGNRGKQATVAQMLADFQPGRISVPGVPSATVSGGMRVSPAARTSLTELSRQALSKLMEGDTFEGGEVLEPPPLSSIPQPSRLETAAGAGGTIGSILGAIAPLFGGRRPTQPVQAPR